MTSYKLNEEKMFADITDGMAIVINGETGIYYGMNSFGTTLFENLIKGASTEVVLEKLKKISEASDIETKFWSFVNIAVEKELLIPRDEIVEVEIVLDEAAAIADEFNLNFSEYNDAQELLLADPIHEVKEETGWSPEKVSLNLDPEDVARREAKMDE
jgi:hypothetical protein